jgi:DUF4097 and DUF4098 domain-containing protein YvlB
MHKTFPTTGPTSLYVEIGSGLVQVNATETTETEVHVDGEDAEDTIVEERGDQIVVIGPQRRVGFFGFGGDLMVTVTLPLDSDLTTKLGSAALVATGRLGAARIKNGSGDVRVEVLTADAVIQSGSGDVEVGSSLGDLRVKSGSGHVQIGKVAGSTVIASGSGRITVGDAEDEVVTKTGSGDIRIADVSNHVTMTSGSGDLEVGRIRKGVMKAKTASGDVRVGVPSGIPVWTDISCLTGNVRSDLEGAGQPQDGQDYIEIRATTVSGDINLSQL